ncbi:hypothetical protein HGRIS_011378 [Hohenbuehelia grisea]|uniref:Cystathionine gamma-synthase n=1 Tax=Hohenbuehelia grisea TaxID=104357 RepID=A0ABR3JWW7_9AGAR
MSTLGNSSRLPSADTPLGICLPPLTPHAISVSLPAWKDNTGYAEGQKHVLDAMDTGYPRFFIHRSIRKLADVCLARFGRDDSEEACMLFPSSRCADACQRFIGTRSQQEGAPVSARVAVLPIVDGACTDVSRMLGDLQVFAVLYPASAAKVAKQFWQHTGLGISSRRAEYYLSILSGNAPQDIPREGAGTLVPWDVQDSFIRRDPGLTYESHESDNTASSSRTPGWNYLETSVQHFRENLPLGCASSAKKVIRKRIAAFCSTDAAHSENLDPKVSGVVTPDDVYLYPSGMVALWNVHELVLTLEKEAKTVCFGFPYTDTLKVLEKWGHQCFFMAAGDLDELEAFLVEAYSLDASKPPIAALFTEFPSNPLLRSPDLERLRTLADKYNFMVVVDATIGNLVNVDVLQYVDVVAHSLSKAFSGYTNVMGGSLIVNPNSPRHNTIKSWLESNYEDTWFDQDAIMMERNSRDLEERIGRIDSTAEALCDFLYARSLAAGSNPAHTVIQDIFYPKFVTRENYEKCLRHATEKGAGTRVDNGVQPGFGGLFTITFTKTAASHAFYHALECYKGPSLGTNFTLASPYTVLAHYAEREWAAGFGVYEDLVRVSVGVEDKDALLATFAKALDIAEQLV